VMQARWVVRAVLAPPQALPPPQVIGAASVITLPSF